MEDDLGIYPHLLISNGSTIITNDGRDVYLDARLKYKDKQNYNNIKINLEALGLFPINHYLDALYSTSIDDAISLLLDPKGSVIVFYDSTVITRE